MSNFLDTVKAAAEKYAYVHGLENTAIVTGKLNGEPVVFSNRAGANRWSAQDRRSGAGEFDPERDGGVFANSGLAKKALEESQKIYGEIDKGVTDIEVVEVPAPSIDI